MKRLLIVFVLLFTAIIPAQTFNMNGVYAEVHVFGGLNVPTQDIEKNQFKFDYARIHVDLSTDIMKVQFRHDVASNKMQLANVSKTFGSLTITAGRFLDPIWMLYPAPHLMSQVAYPVSVNTFTVLDDGVGFAYKDSLNDNEVTFRASIFDCNGARSVSASIDVDMGDAHAGYFVQRIGKKTGFGIMARKSFHKFFNTETGLVSRVESKHSAEAYIQNEAKVFDSISFWLQGDFSIDTNVFGTSRWMVGASYRYSNGSHCKLFYNFTEKVAVAKISFFL